MTENADVRLLAWPGQPRCKYCDTVLSRLQSGRQHCGKTACELRHANESQHQQYRRKWNAFVAEQHAGAAANGAEIVAGAREMGVGTDDVTVGIVPYQSRPLEAVPDARRAAFLEYLREIVAESFSQLDPPRRQANRSQNEAEDPAVSTAACRACLGHCCVLGAVSNAFLKASSIDNVRAAHPDLQPDDVVAYYTSRFPDQAIRGSCIFHGPEGCTLERTWRADMCNNFQCNGKRQGLKRMAEAGHDGMVWIAASEDGGRATVHDPRGTREVVVTVEDRDPEKADAAIAAVRARLPVEIEEPVRAAGPVCRLCGSPLPQGRVGPTCGSAACSLANPR